MSITKSRTMPSGVMGDHFRIVNIYHNPDFDAVVGSVGFYLSDTVASAGRVPVTSDSFRIPAASFGGRLISDFNVAVNQASAAILGVGRVIAAFPNPALQKVMVKWAPLVSLPDVVTVIQIPFSAFPSGLIDTYIQSLKAEAEAILVQDPDRPYSGGMVTPGGR